MNPKFWIGTVSKEHVECGKVGGFAQVCHGKQMPLKRMQKNDILIYYSPQLKFGEMIRYQCFTAIGIILNHHVYQDTMRPDFSPYRRHVQYLPTTDTPIRPLISQLHFIRDKKKWGYNFRFGLFEIDQSDFIIIASAMGLQNDQINEFLI